MSIETLDDLKKFGQEFWENRNKPVEYRIVVLTSKKEGEETITSTKVLTKNKKGEHLASQAAILTELGIDPDTMKDPHTFIEIPKSVIEIVLAKYFHILEETDGHANRDALKQGLEIKSEFECLAILISREIL